MSTSTGPISINFSTDVFSPKTVDFGDPRLCLRQHHGDSHLWLELLLGKKSIQGTVCRHFEDFFVKIGYVSHYYVIVTA